MDIRDGNMEKLAAFKNDMATLFKSIIGKVEDEYLTIAIIEKLKVDIRNYLAKNHPEKIIKSIGEKVIQKPYNIVLHVVLLDSTLSDKPIRVEFPLLYQHLSEVNDD